MKTKKKNRVRVMTGVCMTALAIQAGGFGHVQAATEHWNDASEDATAWQQYKQQWTEQSANYEKVSLTPGKDETELNFAWYSKQEEQPQVRIAKAQSELERAVPVSGTQTAISLKGLEGYYSNKVTVSGLEENTTYVYQVYQNGTWQAPQSYQTHSFEHFSFFYVGDPQIGASKKQTNSEAEYMEEVGSTGENSLAARNDSYNWNKILKNAMAAHPDASFLVSAGDQVNQADSEVEYAGYLSADVLASLPVATTIGNHDSKSANYSYHFNNPNTFSDSETEYVEGRTSAGTDYYYSYGNVLFICLDTNNYNCATHENVIKKAVAEHPEAKWRIVTFHQDIYGSGYDHSDSDGMVLRTQITPLMDKYDIDVVLQGHDHTYSRSYQLTGDGAAHTAYTSSEGMKAADYQQQNLCYRMQSDLVSGTVVNPEGTIYMEANSATGSKFYNLIPTQQDYIAERSQTWKPSYAVVDVTGDALTITSYDAQTNAIMSGSSSYTIVKKEEKTEQKIRGTKDYKTTYGARRFSLGAKADGALHYASDAKNVATVDNKGRVTVKGAGIAHITITADETETKNATTTKITVTVLPKQTEIRRAVAKNGGIQVKWKADPQVNGYQVQYSTDPKFKKDSRHETMKQNQVQQCTLQKVTVGKTYYVRVRSYKTVGNKKLYSEFSKKTIVKIK